MTRVAEFLDTAERRLSERPLTLAELHTVLDGTVRVAAALSDVVSTARRQAPAAFADHPDDHLLGEVLADLRAMHGCLTTAPILLAPAVDDLHAVLLRHGMESPEVHVETGPGPV